MNFAIACHFESLVAVRKKIVGKRLEVSEGQDVVDVAAKDDDAAFVRTVLVDTITFGYVPQGVRTAEKVADLLDVVLGTILTNTHSSDLS